MSSQGMEEKTRPVLQGAAQKMRQEVFREMNFLFRCICKSRVWNDVNIIISNNNGSSNNDQEQGRAFVFIFYRKERVWNRTQTSWEWELDSMECVLPLGTERATNVGDET